MSDNPIKRVFLPKKLASGIFLIVVGPLTLILMHQSTWVLPAQAVVGILLAAPIGVFFILASAGRQCTQCKEVLNTKVFAVPTSFKKSLKAAFQQDNVEEIKSIVSHESDNLLYRIELKSFYCPACNKVAALKSAGLGSCVATGEIARNFCD